MHDRQAGSSLPLIDQTGEAPPHVSNGSGLRGLADRVSALGGGLELRSPRGGGTTLLARIALERQDYG